MASPFLAITLDLKRRIGRAARALGMDVGTMAWGVLELLEHVWERKDPAVSELVVAACFGPDARVAPALVEFGLLVEVADGWELCKEETDRLLLTHRQRVAAGKARAEGAERSGGAFTSARTSGLPAENQRTASGEPALTPSTQHPAPKETSPARARVRAEPGEADRPAPPPTPAAPPLDDLGARLNAIHRRVRGRSLEWGPARHRLAVERALGDLAAEHGDAEVLRRLENALTYPAGKFPYFAVANDLVQHWGRYAEPAPGSTLGSGPRSADELNGLRPAARMSAEELEADAAETARWNEIWGKAAEARKQEAGPDPPAPAPLLAEQLHAEDERHATAAEVLRVVREAVGGK